MTWTVDTAKLRALADWLDAKYPQDKATSHDEVQRDLRTWAAEIDALKARAEKAESFLAAYDDLVAFRAKGYAIDLVASLREARAEVAAAHDSAKGGGRDYRAEAAALLASKDARIARIAADYDAMKTRAEKAEARACRYESFFRLIANRCEFPAPPNAICWHNPAELARDALAEPQGGMTYQDPIDRAKGHDTGGER